MYWVKPAQRNENKKHIHRHLGAPAAVALLKSTMWDIQDQPLHFSLSINIIEVTPNVPFMLKPLHNGTEAFTI